MGLALLSSRGETSRLMSLSLNCSSLRTTHLSVVRCTDHDGVIIEAAFALERSSSSSYAWRMAASIHCSANGAPSEEAEEGPRELPCAPGARSFTETVAPSDEAEV